MKQIFFLLILGLNAQVLFSQDTTASVGPNFIPVIAYWNLNDTLEYSITKTKKKFEDNGLTKDSSSQTYNLKLVVADSTDSTFVIRIFKKTDWDQVRQTITKSNLKIADLKKLSGILDFQYLEYETDEKGIFLKLRNADKLIQATKLILDKYLETNFSEDKDSLMRAIIIKRASPEFLQLKLLEEIKILHKFYGLRYAQDSTWFFNQYYESPLNQGQKITLKNRLVTTLPEDWNGLVRLQNYVTIDGEDAISLANSVQTTKDTAAALHDQEFYKNNPPQYEIYISYAINPFTGIVDAVYYEKSTYLGDQLLTEDSINMELIGDW